MLDNPHWRKKEPQIIRQETLQPTIALAAEKGVNEVLYRPLRIRLA